MSSGGNRSQYNDDGMTFHDDKRTSICQNAWIGNKLETGNQLTNTWDVMHPPQPACSNHSQQKLLNIILSLLDGTIIRTF